MKVCVVIWVDSRQYEGWRMPLDNTDSPSYSVCQAIGFVIKETPTEIVLGMAVADTGNILSPLVIPKAAVTSIKVMRPR